MTFSTDDIEALLGFSLQERAQAALNQKLLHTVKIGGKPITMNLSVKQLEWMTSQIEEKIYSDGYARAYHRTLRATVTPHHAPFSLTSTLVLLYIACLPFSQ